MAVNTVNYNLKKPSQEDFYNIEDHNGNMDIIDTQIKKIESELEGHVGDHEYQNATVNGTQIRLSRQSDTKRLFFYLSNDLSGGNITISIDNGSTSLPLKDIDGKQLTILDKGYWEVVDNTSFFTLRPKGGDERGFYGKYTGVQLTLLDKVKAGDYIYSNEDVQLELSDVTPVIIDHSTAVTVGMNVDYMNDVYENSYSPRLLRMSNGWFITLYNNVSTKQTTIYVSKDNGSTWQTLTEVNAYDYSNIYSCSMATHGASIYVLMLNNTGIILFTIDAETGIIINKSSNLDPNQTSFYSSPYYINNCFIICDDEGVLHAAWNSRNTDYPSYYNVRYGRSTDNGRTWTIKQLTTSNTPDYWGDSSNIYLFKIKNGEIGCVYATTSGDVWYINLNNYLNGSPVSRIYDGYSNSSVYDCSRSLCATVLSDGSIHVAWFEYDDPDEYGYIKYAYTDSKASTWKTQTLDTTYYKAGTVQITADFCDNLYVLYTYASSSASYAPTYLKLKKWTGTAWPSTTLISLSSFYGDYAHCICPDYKYFTSPILIFKNYLSKSMLFTGVFALNTNLRLIPSVNNADNESDLIAEGNGALQTHGNGLKRYNGFVSRKAKGWS